MAEAAHFLLVDCEISHVIACQQDLQDVTLSHLSPRALDCLCCCTRVANGADTHSSTRILCSMHNSLTWYSIRDAFHTYKMRSLHTRCIPYEMHSVRTRCIHSIQDTFHTRCIPYKVHSIQDALTDLVFHTRGSLQGSLRR